MIRALLLASVIGAVVASGCASKPGNSVVPPPPPADTGLNPTSPDNVYPDGWTEVDMIANFAKTNVDIAAHFLTSRNACGRDAFGSLDLALWNSFAKNINIAAKIPPSELLTEETENCVPYPDTIKPMDGTVEIVLANGQKQLILEARGGRECSLIKDPQVSAQLLDSLHQIIAIADKEECALGWGH